MEIYDAIPIKNWVDVNKARKDLEELIGQYTTCRLASSESHDLDVYGDFGGQGAAIVLQSFNMSKNECQQKVPFYRLYFTGVPTAKFVHELAMIQGKYK
ncbi:hypothetical protein JXB28_03085 [Candidatus Woesearchaeota archaeon]|nr:hypothetical protein [Candidatus Woesearchaeota archaeon]